MNLNVNRYVCSWCSFNKIMTYMIWEISTKMQPFKENMKLYAHENNWFYSICFFNTGIFSFFFVASFPFSTKSLSKFHVFSNKNYTAPESSANVCHLHVNQRKNMKNCLIITYGNTLQTFPEVTDSRIRICIITWQSCFYIYSSASIQPSQDLCLVKFVFPMPWCYARTNCWCSLTDCEAETMDDRRSHPHVTLGQDLQLAC